MNIQKVEFLSIWDMNQYFGRRTDYGTYTYTNRIPLEKKRECNIFAETLLFPVR